jgi:Ca-activated chloride channel homolog
VKGVRRATLLVAVWLLTAGAGQAPEPALRIVFPKADDYASGPLVIRAAVEPQGQAVQSMTFFADGRQVCAVSRPPFECEWDAGSQVLEHVLRVVATVPGGRRLVQTLRTRGVEYAEAVDVDMVQVTVSVTRDGKFVRDLPRDAFQVFEDDVRQPIGYFAAEHIPLELVVAVDVSGSMAGAIDQVKANVRRFLSALSPADRVTLAAFNDSLFVLAGPAASPAARLDAVDRLRPGGLTSLNEVIVRSFDLLGTQPGRRGLVMFTDGEDTSSRIPAEAVERRAEASDAVLYMIGQGRAVESPALKDLCERLARTSGGRAFFPRRLEDLGSAFDAIVEELSNQYLLAYAPHEARRDGKWHRLRVEVAGARGEVRARQGYRMVAR